MRGKLVGSKIIGQNFADQVYKNGKPVMTQRRAGHGAGPALLPDAGRRATVPADNAAATTFANSGRTATITEQAIAGEHRDLPRAELPDT